MGTDNFRFKLGLPEEMLFTRDSDAPVYRSQGQATSENAGRLAQEENRVIVFKNNH